MKIFSLFLCFLALPLIVLSQDAGKDIVIGATNMNVLYRGVENPVGIAIPGTPADKVTATISDGTIKKTANGWSVAPGSQDELVITVSASGKKVAEKKFRVKNIPEPIAQFAGKSEGTIDKMTAGETMEITASLNNFLWDLNFKISSFKFVYHQGGFVNELVGTGSRITDQMKTMINGLNSGDKFGFEDIKAVGPDGRIKILNSIILQIK